MHYLVKEWLLAHASEIEEIKEGLRPYLINLVSAVILMEMDQFSSTELDAVFHKKIKSCISGRSCNTPGRLVLVITLFSMFVN